MTNNQFGRLPEIPPTTYIILRERVGCKYVQNITIGVVYAKASDVNNVLIKALENAYGRSQTLEETEETP